VDLLSGGRLTLGLAVGARSDDYEAVGASLRGRGDRLSEQLVELRSIWEGGAVGPRPGRKRGPDLVVGGSSGEAFTRMARSTDGYVHGGGPPQAFASAAGKAHAAWADFAPPDRPQLWGQGYFALGDAGAGVRDQQPARINLPRLRPLAQLADVGGHRLER
jgi:alkanesulfonate monooxygenase SsuD/methylene tetrahydromethanopterin reductase-like flavin-dependent oxidoreductase (luciferase family)